MSFRPVSAFTFALVAIALTSGLFPLVEMTLPARALVLYDSGNPTPDEQLVLEMINRARANPVAEGQRLGIDIHEGLQNPSLVGPRPPLAMNSLLLGIAEEHSRDMYDDNYFSHNDPNGTTPFDRMMHAGYDYGRAGENMAAGTDTSASGLEDLMMVDSGEQGRPHRENLLDLLGPYPCGNPPCVYSEIGVGYYSGPASNSIGNAFITEDFGATGTTGPFLLGVVYNNMDGNNFYDIGESIGGVTITPSTGPYYAVTSSSGGYVIPIGSSGTITVTASGPGFGPVTKTVTLTGENIKLDFTPQNNPTTTFSQSTTQITAATQVSSTAQTFFEQSQFDFITFQTTPSNFIGARTPATINACGNTYVNSQTSYNCAGSFAATTNPPNPSIGWAFGYWTWTGGLTCSGPEANPLSCSATAPGTLTAIYAAQVTIAIDPASAALIGWGTCSGSGLRNGDSFFSTSFGSISLTTCQLPSSYSFSSWTCSGGLTCSSTSNPTTVTFHGPGSITLNLRPQTVNQTNTQGQSSSTTTILTRSAPEFDNQTTLLGAVLLSALLILTKKRLSAAKSRKVH